MRFEDIEKTVMTDSSLTARRRDHYTSRAVQLLADGIGVSKRRVKVGARLMLADAISFLLAALIANAITTMMLPSPDFSSISMIDGLGLPLFLASCLGVGLYKGAGPSTFERLRLRVFAIVLFIAAKLFLLALLGSIATALPGAVILGILLLPAGFYLEILVRQEIMANANWGAPTVVVGTDESARAIFMHLEKQPDLGLRPVGLLNLVNAGVIQERSGSGPPNSISARMLDFENKPEAIVLTQPAQYEAPSSIGEGVAGWKTFIAFDTDRLPSLWLQTRSLGSNVGIELPCGLQLRRNRWLKRIIDIALAGLALFLALPIIAAMTIAIKVIDPGPAFYTQRRIGQNGRQIPVFKIRSMYVDAEQRLEEYLSANPAARDEWQRFFKLKDDPRVLPGIGKFIRRNSLDELPQLLNVMRGDMSIVGPRPFPSYHLDSFDPQFNRERRSVPPGLTGLWQVTSRSNGDLAIQQTQDLFYIRNWSVWLDLYVLLQTPLAVFSRKGAH
jgi:Undecaprenyl-phosphate galactose phosphotransferase WbaP